MELNFQLTVVYSINASDCVSFSIVCFIWIWMSRHIIDRMELGINVLERKLG